MSAKKKLGELRCLFASVLHWRRIRGCRIRSSALFLVASPNTIARSFARFKSPSPEKTWLPNSARISRFTSESSRRTCAASSALKNFAAGSTSRRHSQNVLLPVEIPPVIPMAGIQVRIKSSRGFRAASFSTSVTICPIRRRDGKIGAGLSRATRKGRVDRD